MNAYTYAKFFEQIDKNTSIKEYEKVFDKNAFLKIPFMRLRV